MRKIFSLFAALTLCAGLWAETAEYLYPEYIDGDVTKGIDGWNTKVTDATPITSSSSTWGDGGRTWLVVNSDVTISQRVTCDGEVHLILADGAKLTAEQGITVSGESNSLTIYAQTADIAHMGRLIADATGVESAAGIGGGGYGGNGSNITINGGIITATGGEYGAGIGGGESGAGSNITINGGEVTANGGTGGAGIGGGYYGFGSNITINGGEVTATGGMNAAGIGGGNNGSGSDITINGGEVTATGGNNGAGIGGGNYGSGSNITINGGKVTTGGSDGAGIGGGSWSNGSNITINGGEVTATGGGGAAGIGGGYYDSGSNITINGGEVTATGGMNAAGIGGGSWSDGSNIFVATSLIVKADGNNPPTTVITNTGADLASSLAGKRYATVGPPTPVSSTYLDENGVEQNIDAWEVKDASEAVTWGTAGDTTWFVVKGEDVQLSAGAICAGDVRLILADNAQLTAQGASSFPTGYAGIQVSGEGNSLTIYGQSTGDEMGQLIAYGGYYSAGIGGGIGGSGSNIIINGGKVTANGEESAAGIGGGMNGSGSNITINGGIVEATGMGAGIGGGIGGSGFDIYISDAYVLKAGGYAEDTEVIAHSSAQDLGSTLTQNYVKIEGLAMPYTRTTSVDQWATVCLPYAATSFEGADFYKVNYYDGVDKLYIEPVDNLEAGMPYIFHTTADVVTINHNATAPEAVTAGYEGRGLYGSFARKTIAYDAEHAFAALANNIVNVIEEGHTVTVPACRAYFDMSEVPTTEQFHSAPLRCIGVPSQTPTSLDKTLDTKHQTQKLLHNGQFVIIRDGKTYNAQGQIIQ